MTEFSKLGLIPELLAAIESQGYKEATPIQSQAIPYLLEGNDLLGIAQTGTGKTAAFSLPILQYLAQNKKVVQPKHARVLVLSPTRELCSQINQSVGNYGKNLHIKHTVIFGGVGQKPQVKIMSGGVDVLVATPGRLLDLMNQGFVQLSGVEIFVLDEADRMLDMGFINDIRKIIAKLPKDKQTLLFSATMPKDIAALAANILKNPKRVEVTPESTTVERIEQKVVFVKQAEKTQLLVKILKEEPIDRVLVFTKTKHGANRVVSNLISAGIYAAAIHGNKSQNAREEALASFKNGKIKVLVATDIAARGIDVQGVSHVINYDLPLEAESYVHRIGRTARAGRDGVAIAFCDDNEKPVLNRIEKVIGLKLPTDSFKGVPGLLNKSVPRHQDPRAKKQNQERQTQKQDTEKSKKPYPKRWYRKPKKTR